MLILILILQWIYDYSYIMNFDEWIGSNTIV
jgi:hypothetical protein